MWWWWSSSAIEAVSRAWSSLEMQHLSLIAVLCCAVKCCEVQCCSKNPSQASSSYRTLTNYTTNRHQFSVVGVFQGPSQSQTRHAGINLLCKEEEKRAPNCASLRITVHTRPSQKLQINKKTSTPFFRSREFLQRFAGVNATPQERNSNTCGLTPDDRSWVSMIHRFIDP